MYKRICFVLTIILLTALVSANSICNNAPCEPQINTSLGKEFAISLDSKPGSTGFEWWTNFDPQFLNLDNATFVPGKAASGMVGVSGKETFTFATKKVGNTYLLMLYLQPWENGTIGTKKIFPIVISK